jgi:hypothetical protein
MVRTPQIGVAILKFISRSVGKSVDQPCLGLRDRKTAKLATIARPRRRTAASSQEFGYLRRIAVSSLG